MVKMQLHFKHGEPKNSCCFMQEQEQFNLLSYGLNRSLCPHHASDVIFCWRFCDARHRWSSPLTWIQRRGGWRRRSIQAGGPCTCAGSSDAGAWSKAGAVSEVIPRLVKDKPPQPQLGLTDYGGALLDDYVEHCFLALLVNVLLTDW